MLQSPVQKYLSHPLQGLIAHILLFLLGLVPVDWASAFGGWLARTVGPRLSTSKRATRNLKAAFPEKSETEIAEIVRGVWDNLGRVVFEFPHVPKINVYENPDRFEIVGMENLEKILDKEGPAVFFSAHMANWEIATRTATQHPRGRDLHSIYREPDNPWVRSIFAKRRSSPNSQLLPKGTKGAKAALNLLKSGECLAILVDQKMNDGISVPFFGRDAMTAPAMAQFCPEI